MTVAASTEPAFEPFDPAWRADPIIRLLMIAGTDTTGALIGNTILELVRDRERLAALQADPSGVPQLIEE